MADAKRSNEAAKKEKKTRDQLVSLLPKKVRCEGCKKKCSGDILKTDEKYFHVKCFLCCECAEPLNESGFFVQSGKVYCPTDYHKNFGVRCAECNQFIEGEVTKFLDKSYHPKCFKCDRCGDLVPEGSVTHLAGQIVCKKCCPKSSSAESSFNANLLTPIQDGVEVSESIFSPAVCAACDQCISSGQVLLALDAQWHTWCFKCSVCHCVLHGEYMEKNGTPYCVRDYDMMFGVKCHECNKYIAGKVLQAGSFHFHPACARCSRCDTPFLDGQEMYMQGDEIWHPACNDLRVPRKMHSITARVHRSSPEIPKYTVDFGKHLLYMYLLPEPNMGYLKQPVSPYPPRITQFHTPQGQVKIRRSRISLLKTGMQKLAETLEEATPRPRSPAMNNEEPIELSHYPGAHAPAPGELAPIERDDFPAPPFPYAVDEFKRRLSSNERLDEEEAVDTPNSSRILKAEQELSRIKDESSLAKAFVNELENELKRSKTPLYVDPRSSSRTPNAKRIPHMKCRYESPINASPSRYLNRPRPWQWWDKSKAMTATIPYAQIPKAGYGLSAKAATIPHSNLGALYDLHSRFADATFSSEMSDQPSGSYMSPTICSYDRYQPAYGSGVLRSSLPDMSKPPRIYHYNDIVTTNKKLPEDVDRCHLERHLSRNEFENIFNMAPIEFYKLPEWRRINLKRKAKLF